MNKLILAMMLGALPGAVAAQAAPAVDEVRITRPLDRIELPRERRNVWAEEFDQIKGTYYLSNGKIMQLSMWGNRMYASIDGMPKSQLVAVSPYVFVALDEKLKITIDDQSDLTRKHAELLMVVPRIAGTTIVNDVMRVVASR